MTARAFLEATFGAHLDDALFDELRKTEYARLDADNQAYLDFTGDFGHETGVLEITVNADGLIAEVAAYLD